MLILCLYILLSSIFRNDVFAEFTREKYEQNPAIKRLKEYLQIDTSDFKNAELAVEFWRRQAEELGLQFAVYRPCKLPICVMTLKGNRPDMPSIMLNSHADVVPPNVDQWTYPPFSGHIDNKGHLYGRGSQDTKDVGIQYLEAIRKLIQNNVTLDRTIHITVMPDEETGSFKGMIPFVETEYFKSLNIGFALDEGLVSSNDDLYVVYQDKRPLQPKFHIYGQGGHGSEVFNETAVEGLQTLINRAMDFRKGQLEIMRSADPLDFGRYTTLNINMIQGGVAPNVIITNLTVVMDIRLSVATNINNIENMLEAWLAELSDRSTMEYLRRFEYSTATAVDDSNPYWVAMQETLQELGITLVPVVCPATSDMLMVRGKGIPAFGFTTKRYMKPRFHNVDEYMDLNVFLEGIDIYVALLKNLGNIPDNLI